MTLEVHTLTATSPATATTEVSNHVGGLDRYDSLLIYSELTQATGGVLDVYIQTLLHATGQSASGTWVDYAHFPQLTAGSTVFKRVWTVSRHAQQTSLTTVGATAYGVTPVPALAANTILGGDWGGWWRLVFVAGASTSAGALQTVKIMGSPAQHR